MVQLTPNVMPVYTYTGNHQMLDDGNGHWRIKFLSSGVLEWLSPDTEIDVFLVGGGGAGGTGAENMCGGGGGGYTKTVKGTVISKGQRSQVSIGAGGSQGDGGTTYFNDNVSAAGGKAGSKGRGGDGGCGGGAGAQAIVSNQTGCRGGQGGSDGKNGTSATIFNDDDTSETTGRGGNGQVTSTREFGDSGAELYSGGGGGGCYANGKGKTAQGGKGGSGSPIIAKKGGSYLGVHADADGGSPGGGYGGGGGGTATKESSIATGAQGIVIIRDARA